MVPHGGGRYPRDDRLPYLGHGDTVASSSWWSPEEVLHGSAPGSRDEERRHGSSLRGDPEAHRRDPMADPARPGRRSPVPGGGGSARRSDRSLARTGGLRGTYEPAAERMGAHALGTSSRRVEADPPRSDPRSDPRNDLRRGRRPRLLRVHLAGDDRHAPRPRGHPRGRGPPAAPASRRARPPGRPGRLGGPRQRHARSVGSRDPASRRLTRALGRRLRGVGGRGGRATLARRPRRRRGRGRPGAPPRQDEAPLGPGGGSDGPSRRAGVLYHRGAVRTLYRASRVVTLSHPTMGEWILVDDRHVQRVGTGELPDAELTIDLPGTTIVPGFIDSHVHLTATGRSLANADVRESRSKRDFLALVRERAFEGVTVVHVEG